MPGNNKLMVAAAGAGKTTYMVKEALKLTGGKVLITTFTQANEQEIRKKIIELNHCIPAHIEVKPWFSFLLQHGVRPYQGGVFDKRINGLLLVSGQSGVKAYNKFKQPIYFGEEKEFERHYFTNSTRIYSDKLAKLVLRCNEKSAGAVINRIANVYRHIYIDEVQDLAGYDLELLKLFFACNSQLLLVGDPRQGTYSTNNARKNKQFKKSDIIHFFEDDTLDIDKDDTSLIVNHRCTGDICDLSNELFTDLTAVKSGNTTITGHDGVYFVNEADVPAYLQQYQPMQLRDSRKKSIANELPVLNFGESKGLTFDRVLIYPTQPVMDWLLDHQKELAPTSKSKFYVALTRARASVAIVYNYKKSTDYGIIQKY